MTKVIRFSSIRYIMMILSLVLIVGGILATVARGGFNYGIDFRAGISMRVAISSDGVNISSVRDALAGIDGMQIQSIGTDRGEEYIIKVKEPEGAEDFSNTMSNEITELLEGRFGNGTVEVQQTDYVGPSFSEQLASQSMLLGAFALGLILVYIWFRFKLGYAVSAISALVHDVLFMLGVIGAFQLEVSTATIAAVLTIIGYSLNDTIVIFDRVRENEGILRDSQIETVIDTSISQSLSRTLMTSLTTLLAVGAIYIFGTGAIQTFALNLIIGVVIGTYSSIFIASPVLIAWRKTAAKRKKRRDIKLYGGGDAGIRRAEPSAAPEKPAEKESEEEVLEAAKAEKSRIISLEEKRKAEQQGKKKSRAQRKKKKK